MYKPSFYGCLTHRFLFAEDEGKNENAHTARVFSVILFLLVFSLLCRTFYSNINFKVTMSCAQFIGSQYFVLAFS